MASSVREKMVEQIRAAKRAMRDAEKVIKTKFVRARDEKGRLKADDPSTPDVNEAWEEVPVEEKKPVKKAAAKKKAPAKKKPAAKKSAK